MFHILFFIQQVELTSSSSSPRCDLLVGRQTSQHLAAVCPSQNQSCDRTLSYLSHFSFTTKYFHFYVL